QELLLAVKRDVVDERRDRSPVDVKRRYRPRVARLGEVVRAPLRVDVPPPLGHPVRKLERGIVEDPPEDVLRLSEGALLRHVDEELRDARPREVRAQEPEQEEDGDANERRERDPAERRAERLRGYPSERREDEQQARGASGRGTKTAAKSLERAAPSVKTIDWFDSVSAPRNHTNPKATINRPVGLSGERARATRPEAMNDHPRSSPRTSVGTARSSWFDV